jgi:thiamine kinase-like enzyme
MDYIKGSELTDSWASLSAEQRNGIFKDLKDYIEQMRVLSPPNPGRLESADGSGLFDITRFGGQPFPIFDSVKEFHTHLGHDFVVNSEDHREAWSRFEAMGKRLYHTTFTHSDIAPRNIIVRKGKIAAIVDWETAGWYPEYWEYTRWAVNNYRSPQSWHDLLDEILTPYPDELWVENYLDGVFTRF